MGHAGKASTRLLIEPCRRRRRGAAHAHPGLVVQECGHPQAGQLQEARRDAAVAPDAVEHRGAVLDQLGPGGEDAAAVVTSAHLGHLGQAELVGMPAASGQPERHLPGARVEVQDVGPPVGLGLRVLRERQRHR